MSAEDDGRVAAEAFREKNGLGLHPLGDLAPVIERACGVEVAVVAQGDDAHGMTVRHGPTTVIGVACTPHPMRQRSTLGHEAGHTVFGDLDRPIPAKLWAARTPEEMRADAFARHLLVPLMGLRQAVEGRPLGEEALSLLVQVFGASRAIVAFQLRRLHAIDESRCEAWKELTTPTLATRYGWLPEYKRMAAASNTPRPPQRLLARATAAYAEGVVSAAVIARIAGRKDVDAVRTELTAAGITPTPSSAPPPPRPTPTAQSLSDAELDDLLAGLDD